MALVSSCIAPVKLATSLGGKVLEVFRGTLRFQVEHCILIIGVLFSLAIRLREFQVRDVRAIVSVDIALPIM